MSQNEDQPTGKIGAGETLGIALVGYSKELLRECTQLDEQGNQRMVIPLAQLLIDVRVLELKLQAFFEEAADLVESPKVMARLLRKLDLETRQLKQRNDSRPKVAVASAIRGVNGRNLG
ncbi:MAG: hypothetical protein ACYDAE_29110 [Steroidobacteraceae bacterium]